MIGSVNQTRFGNGVLAKDAAEMVFKTPAASRVLKTLDYQQLGDTALRQVQLIYGVCIASRIASSRSKNEVIETVTRDPLAWLSWFYAMPMLQRVFLKYAPGAAKYRDGLIAIKPQPTATGAFGWLKKLNYMNPLMRYDIPTRGQILDRKAQYLDKLVKAGVEETSEAYGKASKYFDGVLKWRNFSTGLAMGLTIMILGVGIKYINIAVTKARMGAGNNQQPPQPGQ